jgi:hypothetical protein
MVNVSPFFYQPAVALGGFQKSFGVFYMTELRRIRQNPTNLMSLSAATIFSASFASPNVRAVFIVCCR